MAVAGAGDHADTPEVASPRVILVALDHHLAEVDGEVDVPHGWAAESHEHRIVVREPAGDVVGAERGDATAQAVSEDVELDLIHGELSRDCPFSGPGCLPDLRVARRLRKLAISGPEVIEAAAQEPIDHLGAAGGVGVEE